jgi:hypothetical protein
MLWRKELSVTSNDVFELFVELVSQLFHADVFIAEQAGHIRAVGAEVVRL